MSKTLVTLILICFSMMNCLGQNLEQHQWKNRVLVIKTSDLNSTLYLDQLEAFHTSKDGFIERKLIVYSITKNRYTLIDYNKGKLNATGKVSKKQFQSLFKEKENFEILLIGLDGRVKLRQYELLSTKDLFRIIDNMPMRRNEIKN